MEGVSPVLDHEPRLHGGASNPSSKRPGVQPMARDRRARLKNVAKDTLEKIPSILSDNRHFSPRNSYLASPQNVPPLDATQPNYPNFPTNIRVISADTLDAAAMLEQIRVVDKHRDDHTICVLNFANAHKIGGGWRNGSGAQEEQLCFRSTLSATLHPRFYPVKSDECIYSPRVWIFKKSESEEFAPVAMKDKNTLPMVSIISMAASEQPAVDQSGAVVKYATQSERSLMQDKMRMVLRVAAVNLHGRLILGAIGCGVFGHPAHEVADCWKTVLQEKEFKGWFDQIVFAVLDREEGNYEVFKSALDRFKIP